MSDGTESRREIFSELSQKAREQHVTVHPSCFREIDNYLLRLRVRRLSDPAKAAVAQILGEKALELASEGDSNMNAGTVREAVALMCTDRWGLCDNAARQILTSVGMSHEAEVLDAAEPEAEDAYI